jgi:hypothetical protein
MSGGWTRYERSAKSGGAREGNWIPVIVLAVIVAAMLLGMPR